MYRRWARKYLMGERPRFEGHETRAETETAGLMASVPGISTDHR